MSTDLATICDRAYGGRHYYAIDGCCQRCGHDSAPNATVDSEYEVIRDGVWHARLQRRSDRRWYVVEWVGFPGSSRWSERAYDSPSQALTARVKMLRSLDRIFGSSDDIEFD